jgi:hypothetical protein
MRRLALRGAVSIKPKGLDLPPALAACYHTQLVQTDPDVVLSVIAGTSTAKAVADTWTVNCLKQAAVVDAFRTVFVTGFERALAGAPATRRACILAQVSHYDIARLVVTHIEHPAAAQASLVALGRALTSACP